jgi:hypothetical protein
LKPQNCHNCVYAVKAAGKGRSVLVCTNKAGAAGSLFLAEGQGYCRNFKSKRKNPNRPEVEQPEGGEIRLIPLTQGKIAIVDAADYAWLSQYKWHASKKGYNWYACRNYNRSIVYMHRVIMNAPKGMLVDHIDHNSLNNRRSNLRVCTSSENHQNRERTRGTSNYKGVYREKRYRKWRASVHFEGRNYYLGSFSNEVDAAKAYDKKAGELFGEYAYLNFPNFTAESTGEKQISKIK